MVRPGTAALAGLAAGALVGVTATGLATRGDAADAGYVPTIYHESPNPDPRVKVLVVDPADDRGKAGIVRGVQGWRFFEIPAGTTGRCPHELRFTFTAPAEILQIDLSVDIGDPRANLVEFAAAINSRQGYGQHRFADWLMQASWTSSTPAGFIDETVTLPPGVQVRAGDFVGVSGWLGGIGRGDPLRVSPEVTVLYRWL
jgi:hypothetical protein